MTSTSSQPPLPFLEPNPFFIAATFPAIPSLFGAFDLDARYLVGHDSPSSSPSTMMMMMTTTKAEKEEVEDVVPRTGSRSRYLPPPLPLAGILHQDRLMNAAAGSGPFAYSSGSMSPLPSPLGSPMHMSPASTPGRSGLDLPHQRQRHQVASQLPLLVKMVPEEMKMMTTQPQGGQRRRQQQQVVAMSTSSPSSPQSASLSMPTSPVQSPPTSPMAQARSGGAKKRKRTRSADSHKKEQAATAHQLGQQTSSSFTATAGGKKTQSDVVFAQGSHVAKWKLNAPRYKRCKVEGSDGGMEWKKCQHCGTDSTPEWRNGPLGKGTLCNACGLRYRSKQSSRSAGGNVPLSLLLNPETTPKKTARQSSSSTANSMIWEGNLSSFSAI